MQNILKLLARPWAHYADFSGRSRRSEYWLFVVLRWAVLIGIFASADATSVQQLEPGDLPSGLLIFVLLWLFGTMVPAWAVAARRLHDANLSGKWLLTCFVPYLGIIASLVIGLLPGTPGENDKGFDPRESEFGEDLAETFS